MSSQVPCEYLLAVASGRIAVVGTKVFELSPLSIVRSNRLARLNIESGISPLCLQIHFCINTSFGTPSGTDTDSSSRSTCLSTKATRQSTLGYTHGSSLSVDDAQATNLMVTQDTDKVFIQVRPPCGRNTYDLRLIVLLWIVLS